MTEMSVGGHIWKAAMDKPFVVRATVGGVSNEKVGQYETFDEAARVARELQDARIFHAVSGENLTDRMDRDAEHEEIPVGPGPR